MPKAAQSSLSKVLAFVNEFPKEFAKSPRNELYCTFCDSLVKHDKRFFVNSHRESAKHQKAKQQEGNKVKKQQFMPAVNKDFTANVVLSADIPPKKLRNPDLRNLFIQMGKPLPSETSCVTKSLNLPTKKLIVSNCILANKDIFLIVDETDIKDNKFLAILGGVIDDPPKSFMIDCIPLNQSPNSQIILHAIDDVLKGLGTERQQFALLITDAAAYMLSAGKRLKFLYENMFHVTCLSHLLHNAALKVKANYEAVDNLISCVKASTVKNKTRKGLFDSIGVPPQPVVTRWSSWLKAAFYYAYHFPQVCEIVGQFEGDGVIVKKAKQAVAQPGLPVSLMELKRSYASLADLVI